MTGTVADLLVDSDVFIDHLRGAARFTPGRDQVSYSVITRCELYSGATAADDPIDRILAPFTELPVDRPVAELGGRLRREHGIRTPDALIAATALHHGLTLVTRNVKHFRHLPKLRVRPPR